MKKTVDVDETGCCSVRKNGRCRCCGGDRESVGELNSRGFCKDCVAEYSKPEYHEKYPQAEEE